MPLLGAPVHYVVWSHVRDVGMGTYARDEEASWLVQLHGEPLERHLPDAEDSPVILISESASETGYILHVILEHDDVLARDGGRVGCDRGSVARAQCDRHRQGYATSSHSHGGQTRDTERAFHASLPLILLLDAI
jgi:hypothetical protein